MRVNGVLTPWEDRLGYRLEESEDFVEIYCGERRVAVFGTHGGDPELMRKAVQEDIRQGVIDEAARRRKLAREAAKEEQR